MKYFITSFLLVLSFLASSQTSVAPNVTLGAGKVLFSEGALDKELIAELVVTKQDEIKTQLVQNLMNRQLKNSNAAIKHFVSSNLNLLFGESSSETKKKELLKNTAELALVIGVSEYFLKDLLKRTKKQFSADTVFYQPFDSAGVLSYDEFEFMLEFMRNLDANTRVKFANEFFALFHSKERYKDFKLLIKEHREHVNFHRKDRCSSVDENCLADFDRQTRVGLDLDFYSTLLPGEKIYLSLSYYNILGFSKFSPLRLSRQLPVFSGISNAIAQPVQSLVSNLAVEADIQSKEFLQKPEFLSEFKNAEHFANESKNSFTSPNHLYIDLVYKALRENEYVRQFGFFHRIGENLEVISNYEDRIKSANSPIHRFFRPLEKTIDQTITKLFQHYEFVQRIDKMLNLSKLELHDLYAKGRRLMENDEIVNQSIKPLVDQIDIELQELNLNTGIINLGVSADEKELILELSKSIKAITKEPKDISDYLNYFENEILPKLITLNAGNKSFRKLLDRVNDLRTSLEAIGVFQTIASISGNRSVIDFVKTHEAIEKYRPYLSLLNHLGNLDESITYDRIFKFIADLGSICSSESAKNVLNSMVNFMDTYAIIDGEENRVVIDLEGVTGDLYQRYQKNINSRVSLMFTVGLNTASPWFRSSEISFARDSLDDPLSDASFVSEKIGLKWSAIDFNKAYLKGKTTAKPLVSNIHVITYLSGFLYQIDALNSVKGFDSTTLGIGIGTTFFNNLDLNISYAGQIKRFEHDNYLNIGFDIQFTEYLGALSKKRKQKQLDKQNGG